MLRNPHPPSLLPSHRRARLWLLLVWLLSSHGLGPVLMAAAAQATGEHMLKLCSSQHGEMQVVLGHQRSTFSRQPSSAETARPTEAPSKPDHIFQLHSVEDVSVQSRHAVPQQPATASTPHLQALMPAFQRPDPSTQGTRALLQRAPACSAGLQVRSSQTVMRC